MINQKQVLIYTTRRCWRTRRYFKPRDYDFLVIGTSGDTLVTQGESGALLFEIVRQSNDLCRNVLQAPYFPT